VVLEGSDRRGFLRSLAGAGLLSTAGCRAPTDPSFELPASALTDEPIAVEIGGLEPRSSVLVRAAAEFRRGSTWESRTRFEVGADGRLAVPDRDPLEGTYEGIDRMGPFWSMRPNTAGPRGSLPPGALFLPDESGYDVTFTAEVDGEAVAETTTTRRLFDPTIERRTVDHPDLVGRFFVPPGDEPAPGIVHLHGAGGRPHLAKGRLLASRGYATLVLRYFGDPDPFPDGLVEVPVEYVERAVEWLRGRDRVTDPGVGLIGFSRGGHAGPARGESRRGRRRGRRLGSQRDRLGGTHPPIATGRHLGVVDRRRADPVPGDGGTGPGTPAEPRASVLRAGARGRE
jgi:nucleolar protein 56